MVDPLFLMFVLIIHQTGSVDSDAQEQIDDSFIVDDDDDENNDYRSLKERILADEEDSPGEKSLWIDSEYHWTYY